MDSTVAATHETSQTRAIREATIQARNRYAEQRVRTFTAVLAQAGERVKLAILHYKTLGSLPDNKIR